MAVAKPNLEDGHRVAISLDQMFRRDDFSEISFPCTVGSRQLISKKGGRSVMAQGSKAVSDTSSVEMVINDRLREVVSDPLSASVDFSYRSMLDCLVLSRIS